MCRLMRPGMCGVLLPLLAVLLDVEVSVEGEAERVWQRRSQVDSSYGG